MRPGSAALRAVVNDWIVAVGHRCLGHQFPLLRNGRIGAGVSVADFGWQATRPQDKVRAMARVKGRRDMAGLRSSFVGLE